MQITALGADEVPEVKISAQRVSGPGSSPGSVGVDRRSSAASRSDSAGIAGAPGPGSRRRDRSGATAPPAGHGVARRRGGSSSARWPRLGDQQVDVGVGEVAQQVLALRVWFRPDDGGAGERGAAEGEQVVGRVVEQHADVQRPVAGAGGPARPGTGAPTGTTRRRTRRGSTVARRSGPRPGGDRRVGGVAPQQRRRVGRRQRRLARGGRGPRRPGRTLARRSGRHALQHN